MCYLPLFPVEPARFQRHRSRPTHAALHVVYAPRVLHFSAFIRLRETRDLFFIVTSLAGSIVGHWPGSIGKLVASSLNVIVQSVSPL